MNANRDGLSDSKESFVSKLAKLFQTFEDGFSMINSRLTTIEEVLGINENPTTRQEKTNDEGNFSQTDGLDQINICSQPGDNTNDQVMF